MQSNFIELVYLEGTRRYKQGITGKQNREHSKTVNREYKKYNGSGGVHSITSAKLDLYVEGENEIKIDVKAQILNKFNRKRLNENFVEKIKNNIPEILQVERDEYGKFKLSEKSLEEIYITIVLQKFD